MSSSDTLNLFSNLPRRVQRAIDDAFVISINPNQTNPRPREKKRRKTSAEPSGGGFLVPTSASSSGDFVSVQATEEHSYTQIPLDIIPDALQRLDLSPDDEILAVFRNAATGWASIEPQTTSDSERKYVSRDDWRAVCAVLLENKSLEDQSFDDDFQAEGSEYADEFDNSEGSSAASEDEYDSEGERDVPSRRRKGVAGKSRQAVSFDEFDARSKGLTQRQKQTCLDAFALFFPDVSAAELENQRVTIKDLQRVLRLLNEKLKADEVGNLVSSSWLKVSNKSKRFRFWRCWICFRLRKTNQ